MERLRLLWCLLGPGPVKSVLYVYLFESSDFNNLAAFPAHLTENTE